MRTFLKLFCLAGISMIANMTYGQDWTMKKAVIMSPWASKIDTANVNSEYPRPQMVRENWMNLNGIWQYQPSTSASEALPVGKLSSKILVPFPIESAISGVMVHRDRFWYRRKFTVPANWAGERVLIHFGAVDYESEVYVNGHSLGVHTGGYDPFTYDITSFLTGSGLQELTVRVFDPTDLGGQPRGKQTLNPGGIMYTCSSGIWQSVWLEPVPQTSISNLKMVPDIDKSVLNLTVLTTGPAASQTVSIEVKDGANVVTTFQGEANTKLVIPIPNQKLWSPDSPFLYDLNIKLNSAGSGIDSLQSYFGMRKISMAKIGAFQKMLLNNKVLFHMGPLDQGFWPDGLYTAPTDAAMKYDLTTIKKLGFNMVRKHIKVEPYRWYYWADKLGIMVWQDMPSANSYTDVHPDVDQVEYHKELVKMVEDHWNSPCIVMWVVFNEGQAQHNTKILVPEVMALDPSRLVNQASGGGHEGVGHILDVHSYPPPGCPTNNGTQILACGEYGGIGLRMPGHDWNNGFGYVMVDDGNQLAAMYDEFSNNLVEFKTNLGLSAAVYTEITDVEGELNGFLTYDRASLKASTQKIAASNSKAINGTMYMTEVVPAAKTLATSWSYTTTQPTSDWNMLAFNSSTWKKGNAGFGSSGSSPYLHTSWTTSDIWMRKEFTLGDLTTENTDSLALYVSHDEACEIYINGVLAATMTGYNSYYILAQISAAAKKAFKANATNVLAIHCNQTTGGQYMDAGIYSYSFDKKPLPLSINKNNASDFGIYPNPAVDQLNITGFEDQDITATVYNAVGTQVLQKSGSLSSINVSDLSQGVYMIKIKGQNESRCFKFSKKN